MKSRFGFLLFDNFEDMDFVGPWEMMSLWHELHDGPDVLTVCQNDIVKSVHQLTIKPHYTFEQCPTLDYLLVPGGQGTRTEVNNQILISFIKSQAKHCQHVLSVCTGAFLLQAADLLRNKNATTHWASMERLKKFNDVTVVEQRYVRDGNIWTSAGVSAGSDLALAFIANVAGEKVAGSVQLQAEYYPSRKIYDEGNIKLPGYVNKKYKE